MTVQLQVTAELARSRKPLIVSLELSTHLHRTISPGSKLEILRSSKIQRTRVTAASASLSLSVLCLKLLGRAAAAENGRGSAMVTTGEAKSCHCWDMSRCRQEPPIVASPLKCLNLVTSTSPAPAGSQIGRAHV